MKRALFVMLFISFLVLMGCGRQFVVDTAVLSASLSQLDDPYELTEAVIGAHLGKFTPADQAQLKIAGDSFRQLRAAAHGLIDESGGVGQALVRFDQIKSLYEQSRYSYGIVRHVICPAIVHDVGITEANCPRVAQLDPADRATLIRFDEAAQHARRALESLFDQPNGADITQAINDVITIGTTASRLIRAGAIVGAAL
jgi:hypothetical protein